MKNGKNILIIILVVCLGFFVLRECRSEKEITTKIETVIKPIKEPIKVVKTTFLKGTYIEVLKTIKGKDSIVYRDVPTENTVEVKKYNSVLESNNATANIEVTTDGKIYDVTGFINYPEKTNIVTKTIKEPQSGLFGYAQSDVKMRSFGGGLDYNFKNKVIIGAGVLKVNDIPDPFVTIKVGFRIW